MQLTLSPYTVRVIKSKVERWM